MPAFQLALLMAEDAVVLHLIDEYKNVVPSVQRLSEDGLKFAKGALHLHLSCLAPVKWSKLTRMEALRSRTRSKYHGSRPIQIEIIDDDSI